MVPKSPRVELTASLAVFIIAVRMSPCKMLLGIVIRLDKFVTALPALFWIGSGKFL